MRRVTTENQAYLKKWLDESLSTKFPENMTWFLFFDIQNPSIITNEMGIKIPFAMIETFRNENGK